MSSSTHSIIPPTSDESYEVLPQAQSEAPVTSGNTPKTTRSGEQRRTHQARTLQRLYRKLGSWSKLAAELGLNRGLLWKVAHGQIRRSPKVRKALRRRLWQRLVRWLSEK